MTQDERLTNIEVTSEEVMVKLTILDETKAVGQDNVSPWILKEAAQALSVRLARIYNESLMNGELPSCWNDDKCKCLSNFQKGVKEEALNYRPVSLTSIPCKELERIIRLSPVTHLNTYMGSGKGNHA
ncbi:uncharacterized protein [Procambarus clarkii]|uniref:uncharacterized protein n=1 Tax=Procambarus clarkii TaxID=6728 RepID=UPI0037427D25